MVFDQISNLGGNVTPAAFYDVFGTWELIAIPIVAVFAALPNEPIGISGGRKQMASSYPTKLSVLARTKW